MLIFEFANDTANAEAFAAMCRESGKDAFVWASQQNMHEAFNEGHEGSDIFPFVINGVVVTVERDENDSIERATQVSVEKFGGTYVGT